MLLSLPQDINPKEVIDAAERLCPSCGSQGLSLFYEMSDVPAHSSLILSTREEALQFPRGDIALGFCMQCGLITNMTFDATLQESASLYEDQQCFSPTFNAFAREMANRLIKKYDLYDKDIVEIGCGKGDFLLLLCELGHNRGVGIDPTCIEERLRGAVADQVIFVGDYYAERYAHYPSDLVCCRHTLEHIHPTAEFVSTVRRVIGDRLDTIVFFEVPDVIRILREFAFWDIYYEHCSYFSPGSLARLFRLCGFEVIDLMRAYNNQYLLLEARPVKTVSGHVCTLEENPQQLAQDVQDFSTHIRDKLAQWTQRLRQQIRIQGKRAVIWGSGSKCVAFLTILGSADKIEYVVDINPRRHHTFVPGFGLEIMAPEFLKNYKPDLIIVMNPIYRNEICQMLDHLGITTEVISV